MLGLPWREVMNNTGKFEAVAAFGDVIWHMNDKTNLTVGLRYTQDKKEFTWINGRMKRPNSTRSSRRSSRWASSTSCRSRRGLSLRGLRVPVDTPPGGLTKDNTWSDVSPRLVLDYKVNPDLMWFGSLSKGYKAGGYNSVEVGSQFDNEDVWNFETASRARSRSGRDAERLRVLLRLRQQAGGHARRHRRLGHSGVPRRHERRAGLGPRSRRAVARDGSLHVYAKAAFIDATYKDKFTQDVVRSTCRASRPASRTSAPRSVRVTTGSWQLGQLELSGRYAYRGEVALQRELAVTGHVRDETPFAVAPSRSVSTCASAGAARATSSAWRAT
jgi:iron complex outermembrane receptor protein